MRQPVSRDRAAAFRQEIRRAGRRVPVVRWGTALLLGGVVLAACVYPFLAADQMARGLHGSVAWSPEAWGSSNAIADAWGLRALSDMLAGLGVAGAVCAGLLFARGYRALRVRRLRNGLERLAPLERAALFTAPQEEKGDALLIADALQQHALSLLAEGRHHPAPDRRASGAH